MDILSYILAKKYADKLVVGGGAIKGKNCIIENIEPVVGATRVHFKWTLDDGTVQTDYIDIPDGEKGDKGDTGDIGPIGPKGDTGAQGVQGLQGAKGDKGDKGDVGNTGATGATGAAATIQVGSVVSGVSPSITNAGTSQNAVFNFVLPKGDKGDTGEKGADGADGKSFEIKARFQTEQELIAAYPTGPDNPSDAYFVGTTTSPDLYTWLSDDDEWFNNGPIAGVKGDKGDTGDDGFSPVASVTKAGGIATITIRDKVGVTTATVSDGINGVNGKSAYEIAVDEGFVGTESEWLASLVGAKGETGEQGEQGIQGVQGVKGDQGIQGVKGDAGFSPVANVTENNGVYTIHIEDESGTTEEEIDMSSYASTSDISTINSKIPSNASSSNKMATASDITNITNKIPSNASSSNKMATASDITNITNKIPSSASSSNKLVTESDNNFKYTNLGDVVVDVNTLISTGVYSVRNKSSSTQHLPSSIVQDAWCVIYVTEVDNNPNFVQQKCIDWSGNEWNRYSQSGTWFSWVGIQKEDTAVKWIGSAGGMTLAQIYAAYSQQNTRIYKGFLDWQDTRVPLYGQGADTVEITCYDWNLTATTIRGKSFWYDSSTDSWIENAPIVTMTSQIWTDVNGNIGLYAILPPSANIEIISVRGTDTDSDFTYIPCRNYQGDWWCQLFTWAGIKATGVHTYNVEIKYRRLA